MKTTEKIALTSGAIGAAVTGALYYFLPELHWGWYTGAFLFTFGSAYAEMTKQTARERIANRDLAA